jgi:transcription antitermination factor NusG
MILYRGEQVATVPNQEIEAIQRVVDGPCQIEPYPFLKCGTRVRVIRGSLEGVEGILVRKKNLFRLVLSVDMLAQSVAVEVHADDVEPCGRNDVESKLSLAHPERNRFLNVTSARTAAL